MRKIVVAGAGHGGIAAAMLLAGAGHDVTVYEKQKREELGHDWQDCMSVSTFNACGFECPSAEHFGEFRQISYRSHSKKTMIITPKRTNNRTVNIERKFLLRHLISQAEKSGVRFVFEAEAVGAVFENGRVTGISVLCGGRRFIARGDLVIDSAGCFSPVRSSLPREAGIIGIIGSDSIFSVYRAYYEKTAPSHTEPPYNITFYHCRRKGMDWMIDEDDHADILVGAFGPLTEKEKDEAVADYMKDYPFIGKTVLRGGSFSHIPLRRALPVFVCGGYAAIGDCASMTEPLSGSGIDLSMRAGKILADTVVEAGDAPLTVEVLWKYNHRYMLRHGLRQLSPEITKGLMTDLSPDDMDALFDKKVLTAKELTGKSGYSPAEIMQKAIGIISRPGVIPPLVRMAARTAKIKKIKSSIPEAYSREAVLRWAELYEKL